MRNLSRANYARIAHTGQPIPRSQCENILLPPLGRGGRGGGESAPVIGWSRYHQSLNARECLETELRASGGHCPPPLPPLPKGGSFEASPRVTGMARRDTVCNGNLKHFSVSSVGIVCLVVALIATSPALAQAPKAAPKAADVFDDDEKKPAETQKSADPAKTPAVTDRDSIGFTQENVAAQMTELEERMFRLSEALKSLEPENASRLSLALKFSREELILHQMQSAQKVLKDAQLNKAETEVRELLAKLEHLRNLLLAEDLDFQMKLARLRQMRETLGQLERIIKEERRELAWSRAAVEQQEELTQLRDRRAQLETLVRDQKSVIHDTKGDDPGNAANRERETNVKKKASELAADPLFASLQPPHLKQADPHLEDALTLLAKPDAAAAEPEEKALEQFQKELDRLNERIAAPEKALAAPEFQRFERDQARNRNAADSLAKTSARLGNTGVSLQKDLIRAGGSMQAAEGDLAKTAAKPASEDQLAALKHLVKSQDDLARAIESLLVELRSELQTRIIAELTEMHEIQMSIRETTEAQAPKVAQGSRTASILVAGESKKEGEIAERIEHLRVLTEETEFGIALPTALGVLGREMRTIQGWLKESDASPRTIALEKRVEDDLLGLLEAMRRLPPTTPPKPGSPLPSELRARERELNRLVAELKMIRLLQSRLNDDTTGVDHNRPKPETLTPALRREIEALKANQDEIRDSLAKISARLEAPEDAGDPPIPGVKDR